MRRTAWQCRLLLPTLCVVSPITAQVDQQRAEGYFAEARAICERDGGRLWGMSLCGPMVIADARTGTMATNVSRPTSDPPRVVGFTNAPIEWGGSTWAAYMWDFTASLQDARVRGEFLLHELFHRIQSQLDLVTVGGPARAGNEHLDTVDGRIWLRLEWRALAKALILSGDDRKRAVADALAFRTARRAQFADAASAERAEEIREGLAQYTGIVATAASRPEAVASAVLHLIGAEGHETFLQQSYTTGVAYAVLLDDASTDWRRHVRRDSDLGEMLMVALDVAPVAGIAEASERYGSAALRALEQARAAEWAAVVQTLRERFVEGPVLHVPSQGGAAFNAVGATPIPGVGTVYFNRYTTRGAWGMLEATKGILVVADGARRLAGPVRIDGVKLAGVGWTVTVANGWIARPGPRPGDYQLLPGP